ncbi:hypothetical protein CIT26_10285 [Mesorhizobium temperatum]|uniref:Uncharacterized protein n=1 Tax=Mesorhizobium temperatum TaxID=241416 RepID=A0A271LPF0_9HYPH|nr:hypothetical protein CIT26_10285 [Mesorhizobium temperatum]
MFVGRSAAGRPLWRAVLLALLGGTLGFVVFATGRIAGTRAEYSLRERARSARARHRRDAGGDISAVRHLSALPFDIYPLENK